MEKNYVYLTFDPTVTRLAGFDYGKSIYKTQVDQKIDFSSNATIEFPSQIIKVASSFVQGFFEEIIKQAGLDNIGTMIKVVSGNDELTRSILNNLV